VTLNRHYPRIAGRYPSGRARYTLTVTRPGIADNSRYPAIYQGVP